MRVEDLARAADVSVDTIRFYQKRRLLDPPAREGRIAWYGPEHVERLARIRDLQARGFSLALIRRLLDGELDAADEPLAAAVAGAQHGFGRRGRRRAADAGRAGGALGRARVDAGDRDRRGPARAEPARRCRLYSAADVELVGAGLRLLEAGFPLPTSSRWRAGSTR